MKNVLLPTDFSDNAKNAMNYAMEFFKNETCTFYMLHIHKSSHYITDDLMTAPTSSSVHESVISVFKKKLTTVTNELKSAYAKERYAFHTIIDYDDFVDAIKQTIASKDIHLIVMGTNGATGAIEVVFGSNTLNVIKKVSCPVIAVPQGYKFKKPKTILYAIDKTDRFHSEGIAPLYDTISRYKASLRIVTIKEDDTITVADFDDKKQMKAFFKDVNHSFHSIINIPTALAIHSFVQIMDIDLTAMFIKRETFMERFFIGTETSKISYGTRVPLLIMHS
ncbi:universal stress protein [Aquimarina sp. U1-2]|uniref:universal stress protein n=1 Tax=Aquimarina sp. U1-2 TaxID=2823141 RepID=UPI001AEC7E3E|nr:universal stress protein [Aquimarina sp. U1-2]MBP2831500.1 universal stress protein [Aquimarina sp. U1-2]